MMPGVLCNFATDLCSDTQTQYLDNYFLDSSSNISCFFEEGAFDKNKTLVQPKAQSINKIGHGEERNWVCNKSHSDSHVLCVLSLAASCQPHTHLAC